MLVSVGDGMDITLGNQNVLCFPLRWVMGEENGGGEWGPPYGGTGADGCLDG